MTVGNEQPSAVTMKINFKQIEAFVWVADLQSFRRAAERMNTTQPNIASRIAKLEEQFGQILLKRSSSSVSPTRSGRVLLGKAQAVLLAVDDLMETSGASTLFEGALRVGVTEIIAHSWLGEFLNAFCDTVVGQLKDNNSVAIAGFGQFVAKHRPAREMRNPATGQMMMAKAKTSAQFKPSVGLKDL